MVAAGALTLHAKGLGVLAAALAGSGTLLARGPRARALAALAAAASVPALVIGEVSGSPEVSHLRAHPALAAGGALVALAAMALLAALFLRRPAALALLAVAALPFRIPIQSGSSSANLLIPLYVVIGGGVLAYAFERVRFARTAVAGNGAPPGDGAARVAWGERSRGRVELALALFVTLYALQSIYSTDVQTAIKNVAFFYVPFMLLFRLLTTVRWSRRLLVASFGLTVALALVFAGAGFVEYATKHLLWNQKVIASNQFESYFRVNSLFFDPSIYGRYLDIVMVGLAATLVWPRRGRREILLVGAALAILWAGLVLSFSQSSFVALLVGLAILCGLRWDPRPVLFGAAVAVALGLVVVAADPSVVNLNTGSSRSVNKASSGRLKLVSGGLTLFSDRPLWGWGAGSFAERYRAREGSGAATAASASHTIPLTVAAEQGLIGLAAYLFVVLSSFLLLTDGLAGLRARAPPDTALLARAIVAAGFGTLVFHTLLYADFLEDPITWTLLAVGSVLAASGAGVVRGTGATAGARLRSFIGR